MEETVPFWSPAYLVIFGLLVFSRGMDFLSTWLATPNLVLEANPIAKKLGWKLGLVLNVVICFSFALWPLPSIVIITTSLLVAARNFQSAWLMRSMGEHEYRTWMGARLLETSPALYYFCLLAQSILYGMLGGLLMFFADNRLIPFGVGMGMITYAFAVLVFSLLSVSRLRRRTAVPVVAPAIDPSVE
jgi:hypothetical protein